MEKLLLGRLMEGIGNGKALNLLGAILDSRVDDTCVQLAARTFRVAAWARPPHPRLCRVLQQEKGATCACFQIVKAEHVSWQLPQ